MSFYPLYIDPGTGSMLFSILIGATATLFFLIKAAWLKIKLLFAGKNNKASVDSGFKKCVIYNEGRQYINLFEPILNECEKRKLDVTYYTSYEQDPLLGKQMAYVHSEYIGTGNKAYARLNMLSAEFVLMTTPGLNVYQLKRSKNVKHYSHILHAPSDAILYRLFGLDYFDSVLLTGDYQAKDIRILEDMRCLPSKELITVGCSYLDTLQNKISSLENEANHTYTVLVSPSWGSAALLSRFGEKLLDPLSKTDWRIIVRPHPQSKKSESEMLERLQARYSDCSNMEWDFNTDNIISMKKSDIMISDFSGIIFDYTFLFDKPVMYVDAEMDIRIYDAYDIEEGKNVWQFNAVHNFGIELLETQFSDIKNIIQKVSDSEKLAKARKLAKEEAWFYQGKAAEHVVDFILSHTSPENN